MDLDSGHALAGFQNCNTVDLGSHLDFNIFSFFRIAILWCRTEALELRSRGLGSLGGQRRLGGPGGLGGLGDLGGLGGLGGLSGRGKRRESGDSGAAG